MRKLYPDARAYAQCFATVVFFLLFTFIADRSAAQSSANYTAVRGTDGSLALDMNGNAVDMTTGTTSLIGTGIDDGASAVNNIGFDFAFMGTIYSQFSVNSNGHLRFGATTTTSASAFGSAGMDIIAPFGEDLTTSATGAVHFKVVGTAPNRTLVVEFLNMEIDYGSTTADGTFQLRLYETTGVIEFVYGAMSLSNAFDWLTPDGARIGFSKGAVSATNTFTVVTPSTYQQPASLTASNVNNYSVGVITDLNSATDGSRVYYRFIPTAPGAPTGLTIAPVTATTMTLNWTDSPDETGYFIYRSTDNITFSLVSTLAANTVSSVQSGLSQSTTYYWRIYAVREIVSAALAGNATTSAGTLSGIKTVGAGGDYDNLTIAFTDITNSGLAGNVELQMIAGYPATPETYPIAVSPVVATGTFSVLVYPTVAGLSINGTSTTGTISFDNSKNVTFDGRVNATGSAIDLIISNNQTAGYAIQFINGSTDNTIKYTSIRGVTTGTTNGVIRFSTTANTTGNNNNTIDNNEIRDGATTPNNLIYASGTSATPNTANVITNNRLFNFFSATTASNGMNIGTGNTGWTITGNSIYQTASRTFTTAATHAGILVSNTSGNGFTINNNFIGGGAANAGGGAWTILGSVATRFRGISLSAGTTTASTVQNNTIANFAFTANTSATTAGGPWTGIYLLAGNASITGNTIGSGTATGSITLTALTSNGGISSGIFADPSPTVLTIQNNTIGGVTITGTISLGFQGIATTSSSAASTITIDNNLVGSLTTANSINANTGATSTTAQVVRGIFNSSSATIAITNNTVANLNNNYLPASANTSNHITGISSTGGVNTITGNTVRNLSSAANATGTGASAAIIGMSVTSTTAGTTVSSNTVHTIAQTHGTAAVNIAGMYYSGATTGTNLIGRNFIHSLSLSSTSATATIIGLNVAGGASTFQNNMIRLGVNAAGASITTGNVTVGIDKGITAANNFYHNSVYIGGTGVASSAAGTFAFRRTSTGVDNVQNNIFVNQRSNSAGSAKHYVFGLNAATTMNSTHNVFYGAGSGFVFGYIGTPGTTDYASFAAFKGASGLEAGSAFGDPQFIAPTGTSATVDLHIHATNPTPVEGQGTLIAGVTDDYDGQARSGLTPVDIGADAGNFVQLDIAGPAITYTLLGGTTCTANRTLTATITDNSGINVTAGTKPRLYFRRTTDANAFNDNTNGTDGWKFVEASNATSPFSFTIDVSLLNGGTGLAGGQSLQYFVVAQDLAATPNVSINTGTFATAPTTVALTGANFPVTTTNSYSVANGFSNPSVTIGAAGDYASLTGAGGFFSAINTIGGISTDITVTILDAAVAESGANALNALTYGCAGSNTITIKPATGVDAVLSGSSTTAIIKLNGADNIVIDGSNNGTSSRNLTIENTSTAANTAAIWVASTGTGAGATNNTIKNTIVKAGSNTVTTTFGIFVGGTSISTSGTGDDNDNLTIQNNSISKAYYGLYAAGSALGINNALTVANNSIGSNTATDYITFRGMVISQATGASITGNTVFNMISANTLMRAMEFGTGFVNSTISKNTVTEINYTSTSFSGGKGITLNTGSAASNVILDNNVISALKGHGSGTATNNTWAIMLEGTTGGVELFYNSINIPDNRSSTGSSDIQGGLYIASGVTGITLKDNVISVTGAPGNATSGKMFAIYSLAATPFTVSNRNDLYVTGSRNFVGFIGGTDRTDLAAWQAGSSQDANSISLDPLFNSATNLIPQPGSPLVGAGEPVSVTTDFNGVVRSVTTPTIGAYENTLDLAPPVITYTALGGACNTADRLLSATITDGGGLATGANAPRIYFRKNSGSWFSLAGTPGAGSTWDFTITNVTMGGVVMGDVITYYVIAQDLAGNVISNPAGAVATDVNTVTTHPGTPNSYIVSGTLNGLYTVGSTGTIPTLTHAASLYNAGCPMGGAVTFSLVDEDYTTATEIFPINFLTNSNASAVNTLTIKPAAGVTPTIVGNTSPLIKFKGTDFVTIDGSNTVGGATRDLTLQNTSTVSGSSVVWIGSLGAGAGATYVTVKNSNIVGGSLGSSSISTFGIVALDDAGAANGPDNDNLSIENNSISNVTFGIQTSGTPANTNDNTVITGNTIGSSTVANSIGRAGIVMSNTTNSTIWGNTIFNVQGNGTVGGNNVYGIQLLTGTSGTVVNANNIYGVRYTGTSGYGGKGIELNGTGATANIRVSNNMISEIGGDSWTVGHADAVIGINLTGTNGAIELWYNSVNMNSGTFVGHASATFAAAFNIGSGSTALDIRNNIFSTNLVNSTVAGAKTYAIYSAAPNTAFTTIDYNDYYVSGSQGVLGNIGSADQATLAALAAAFTGNANSLNVAPYFVSSTDAHLQPDANCELSGKATPIGTVTMDFDGESRNATTPDIGADEFTNTFVLTITNPAAVCTGTTVDLTLAAVTAGSTTGTLSYWTDAAATSALATPAAVGTGGTYYIKLDKGTCSEIEAVTVTVDPASVGGTASADQTICSGTAPANITLAGHTGTIVKWQRSSTNDFSAGVTDINVTATTLNGATDIGNLTATTYFRAVVKSGVCSEANSSVVTVTVDPVSVGGTASANQTICTGSVPADITLAGNTGNVVKWQRSTVNDFSASVTDINVMTTTLSGATDIGALTTTTYFRAVVKSGVCTEANSTVVTITVDPVSVGGTASANQTICSGSSPADITLSGNTGAVVKWQASTDPGFGVASDINVTSTTLTGAAIGNLAQTTYFRAVVKSGVCTEANSSSVMVTVDPASVGGTASSNQTICAGSAPANITVAGITGNIVRWERSTTAGFNAGTVTNINVTSATLNGTSDIGILSATTYIRAVVKSGVCNQATSSVVTITVDPASVGGTVSSNQTICTGTAPADITLGGHTGTVVKWQRISSAPFSTPVDIASTNTTLTSAEMGTLTETTYFRAVVKSGVCAETFSAAVTITVSPATVAGTVSGAQTICIGNPPISDLTLSGHTGNVVKWQKSTDAAFTAPVDVASTATTLTSAAIGPVNENTYFRAVIQSPGCTAANTNGVLIGVNTTVNNATALAGVVGGPTVCANYSVSTSNNFLNNCDLIATVVPSGASPVSGNVSACVKIDGSVQIAPTGESYVQRHYDILPASNATTATSTITLYFKQSEFDAFNLNAGFRPPLPTGPADATGIANLRITQYNGTGTAPGNYTGSAVQINPADANITYNAAAARWSVTFDVTGSGGFYVHTGQFVLPVTLLEFKGEQAGDINKLTWKTATEIDNRGFEVERSADGANFSAIAFVATKAENGNSNSSISYGYNDVRPMTGNNYYRLKQIDKNGKVVYSNIILLSRKVTDITLSSVYPNPTPRTLNLVISSPKAEKVTIVVTDLSGKVLMQQPMQLLVGENQQKLDVLHLAAGTYFIKAVCSNGCETAVHRFIKY